MRILIVAIAACLLVACSKPHEKYVGFWKLENEKPVEVLKISKEGGTYLLDDNILREIDFRGNKKDGLVMEEKGDRLALSNGYTLVEFNVSDDGKILRYADKKYSRIDEKEANQIKVDNDSCQALRDKYLKELDAVNSLPYRELINKKNQIGASYMKQQSSINECDFHIASF